MSDIDDSAAGPLPRSRRLICSVDQGGRGLVRHGRQAATISSPTGRPVRCRLLRRLHFANIKGNFTGQRRPAVGLVRNSPEKIDWSWAVGGRVGFVASETSDLLQRWLHRRLTSRASTFWMQLGAATGLVQGSRTRDGWFLGGGTEYQNIQIPGLFWKTEVRFSTFDSKTANQVCAVAGACGGPARSTRWIPAVRADRYHRAGLPLQLGWPGRREVLISAKSTAQKPRHRPGLFCAWKGARRTYRHACLHWPPPATAAFSDQYARRSRHSISDQSGSVIVCPSASR